MSRYARNLHARQVMARAGYDAGGDVTPADTAPQPIWRIPSGRTIDLNAQPRFEEINPWELPPTPRVVSPVPPGDKSLVFGRGARMPGYGSGGAVAGNRTALAASPARKP
jgi:hypothetical protein